MVLQKGIKVKNTNIPSNNIQACLLEKNGQAMKQDLCLFKKSINLGTKINHMEWKLIKVPKEPSVLTKNQITKFHRTMKIDNYKRVQKS